MKTNESFFSPKRLVFMGAEKAPVSAEVADKAKPDYSDGKARSELLQQVDKKLAQLEKSDKPADQAHASRLREAKDKAVLDMLGGVKEVEAANRLYDALTGKTTAATKRAEVRAERTKLSPEVIERRAAKAEEKDAVKAYRESGEKGTRDKPQRVFLENGAVYDVWESSGSVSTRIQKAGERDTYRQDAIDNA